MTFVVITRSIVGSIIAISRLFDKSKKTRCAGESEIVVFLILRCQHSIVDHPKGGLVCPVSRLVACHSRLFFSTYLALCRRIDNTADHGASTLRA